eukprot:89260-Chlamydomonas_euryale.AAC.1
MRRRCRGRPQPKRGCGRPQIKRVRGVQSVGLRTGLRQRAGAAWAGASITSLLTGTRLAAGLPLPVAGKIRAEDAARCMPRPPALPAFPLPSPST